MSERREVLRETYGTHDQTAHVWAQDEVMKGRSSDGRIFFLNGTIYSYGSHFPMATIGYRRRDGLKIVYVSQATYSISTSAHQRCVASALDGRDDVVVVKVPSLPLPKNEDDLYVPLLRDVVSTQRRVDECTPTYADEDDTYQRRQARVARTAFEAMFGKVPKNAAAIVAREDARLENEARAKKLCDAVFVAKQMIGPIAIALPFPMPYGSQCGQDNLKLARSARLTLGKLGTTKAHAKLKFDLGPVIKSLSILDKEMKAANQWWEAKRQREQWVADVESMLDYIARGCKPYDWRYSGEIGEGVIRKAVALGNYTAEQMQALTRVISRERGQSEIDAAFHEQHPNAYNSYRSRAVSKTPTADQWRAGEGRNMHNSATTLLRLVRGDTVQTSRGAEVPLKAAIGVYLKASECARGNLDWRPNGERVRVGAFQVDSINGAGTTRIGCHTLQFDEMERLACQVVPHLVKPRYGLPAIV